MKDAVIEYEILNWEKYNPRTDAKATTWCRLDFGMAASADCVRMEDKVFRTWVTLLCDASTKRGKGRVALSHLSALTRTSLSRAWVACQWLQVAEMIKCELMLHSHTNGTNGTNGTKRTNYMSKLNAIDTDRTKEDKPKVPGPRILAELWNELTTEPIRKVDIARLSSDQRRWTWAKARLSSQPDLGYWRQVIETINQSSFCRGDNGKGWTADFEFLVRKDSHTKVLEGKYSNQSRTIANKTTEFSPEFMARLQAIADEGQI